MTFPMTLQTARRVIPAYRARCMRDCLKALSDLVLPTRIRGAPLIVLTPDAQFRVVCLGWRTIPARCPG